MAPDSTPAAAVSTEAFSRRNVDLHAADDRAAGPDDLDRQAGSRRFRLVPCIGWIVLNSAVIAGAIAYG